MDAALDAVLETVINYYAEGDNLLINLWYDKEKQQDKVAEYKEPGVLYGMAEAANWGDLLFLSCDIYFYGDFDSLNRARNVILHRDNQGAP